MARYQTAVENEINSQLRAAGRLSSPFYTYPQFFSHFFANNQWCCSGTLSWYRGEEVSKCLGPGQEDPGSPKESSDSTTLNRREPLDNSKFGYIRSW